MKMIKAILLKNWTPCRRVKLGSIIEVPENLYDGALKSGIIGEVKTEAKPLSQMNVAELEIIAADEGVDFADCKNKKDRVTAIQNARMVKDAERQAVFEDCDIEELTFKAQGRGLEVIPTMTKEDIIAMIRADNKKRATEDKADGENGAS